MSHSGGKDFVISDSMQLQIKAHHYLVVMCFALLSACDSSPTSWQSAVGTSVATSSVTTTTPVPPTPTPTPYVNLGVVTTFVGAKPGADGPRLNAAFNTPYGGMFDSSGNLYVADSQNHVIRKISTSGTVTTIAGLAGSSGNANGTGAAARFNFPASVVIDSSGNLFVADDGNQLIRKITAAGVVSTFAGSLYSTGCIDGTGSVARFNSMYGMTIDSSDNLYVADSNNQIIRKITSGAVVTTLAGQCRGGNGTGASAEFYGASATASDSSGNVYVADTADHVVRKITAAGVVTTLAGQTGACSYSNGTGTAAGFCNPAAIAINSGGTNLYVADGGHTIRKVVISTGVVTTIAGTGGSTGTTDATGAAARFYGPKGIVVDSTETNAYVSDTGNHTIRKVVISTGVVTTLAGTAGSSGSTNATGTAAKFFTPYGIGINTGGTNLYVADQQNQIIRQIVISTAVVTTFAGTVGSFGTTDATGTSAKFYLPTGLTIDGSNNLFVTDYNSYTIRKVTSGAVVTTLAGSAGSSGYVDASGTSARFRNSKGLSVDGSGNLYVADVSNNVIRKVTSGGVVTTLAGAITGADGIGNQARFNQPTSVATDGAGNLYVADTNNSAIRKIVISSGTVTTIAGQIGAVGSSDGTGTAASFNAPWGVCADNSYLYIMDTNSSLIRRMNFAGTVTTIAGTYGVLGATDGAGASALFQYPHGCATDGIGNAYVMDSSNNLIRKIDSSNVVSTFAGVSPGTDGTGTSATFTTPSNMVADSSGNLFVADTYDHLIRKITPSGVVTTFAGQTGVVGTADGTGTSATFSYPIGITMDSVGNLFVTDNNSCLIRKVTPAGVVTTIAGTGSSGSADGTGTAASFSYPNGITVDSADNLYVIDAGYTIRKITPAGVVSTFAGATGVAGSTDAVGTAARFNNPVGITYDKNGNLYVTDTNNHTIRKIVISTGVVSTVVGTVGVSGSADGTGTAATFNYPQFAAVDSYGNLYVTDGSNYTIRKITASGVVTTFAGTVGSSTSVDGTGTAASFTNTSGIAIDVSTGTIYVADSAANIIRKIR